MTTCLFPAVDILRIPHVEYIKSAGQRVLFLGHTDEVNMICHKAICPDVHRAFFTVFFEPFKVVTVVVIALKYRLSVIASLGDMMGIPFCDNSCYSRHDTRLYSGMGFVNK